MRSLSIFLSSLVLLLAANYLEINFLAQVARLSCSAYILFCTIPRIDQYIGLIKRTSPLLIVLCMLSFSLNGLLGIFASLLTFAELHSRKDSNAFPVILFWLINLIAMLIQLLGVSDLLCLHTPFECSTYNFLAHAPVDWSSAPYLGTVQKRPPGIFSTQIHQTYFILLTLAVSRLFSAGRSGNILNGLLLLTLFLSGSQVFILVAIFLVIPIRLGFFTVKQLSVFAVFCTSYALVHPAFFAYNYADFFDFYSSFIVGREAQFLALQSSALLIFLAAISLLILRPSFRLSTLGLRLYIVGIAFCVLLTHLLIYSFPGMYALSLSLLILFYSPTLLKESSHKPLV